MNHLYSITFYIEIQLFNLDPANISKAVAGWFIVLHARI